MNKLIIDVNEEQKETLLKLFEMLHLKVEVELEVPDGPEGDQERLKSALDVCGGMWKDVDVDFNEYRKQAWGGRGV